MDLRKAIGLVSFVAVLSACSPERPAVGSNVQGGSAEADTLPPERVIASTPSGQAVVLEVARSDAERARGLMFRPEVPSGTGMIFFYAEPGAQPIWMFNCLTSLDLIWLDAKREIVHLVEAAPICPEQPCPSYASPVPASYVIEVAAGEARGLGLLPGARVLLSTPDGEPLR